MGGVVGVLKNDCAQVQQNREVTMWDLRVAIKKNKEEEMKNYTCSCCGVEEARWRARVESVALSLDSLTGARLIDKDFCGEEGVYIFVLFVSGIATGRRYRKKVTFCRILLWKLSPGCDLQKWPWVDWHGIAYLFLPENRDPRVRDSSYFSLDPCLDVAFVADVLIFYYSSFHLSVRGFFFFVNFR